MLKYPCLILDHDDTVVQSERTINFPYFAYILDVFRPGTKVTPEEYTQGCYHLGFADMCRKWYDFTEQEIVDEFLGWKEYIRHHIPEPFPGMDRIIRRQKALGGRIFVVSHSSEENITRDYAAHFGIQPDAVFGWDLPEHQRKPSTYAVEQIMQKYGYRKDEMLVVDDMKPAYVMASAAGIPIAFAAWGRKDYPEICKEMENICDFAFDTPEKLEKFLFDGLTDMV